MKVEKMWKTILLMFTLIALSVGTFSCDDDNDNDSKKTYTISGNADGSQMVPAVNGDGTGTVSGTYNPNTRVLAYTTNWADLTGAPTGGGFYSGATGVNGSIIGAPWAFDSNATSTGTRTGTMTLTYEQAQQLLNGGWYYLFNTAENLAGEIHGQVTATRSGGGSNY
jgi:hypothetical protein